MKFSGFKNWKIRAKLLAGFILLAVITVAVGSVGYFATSNLGRQKINAIKALNQINLSQVKVIVAERGLINDGMLAKDVRQAQYDYIDKALVEGKAALEAYDSENKTSEEAALWADFLPLWDDWLVKHQEVVAIAHQRDELSAGNADYKDIVMSDADALQASLVARDAFNLSEAALEELVDLNKEIVNQTVNNSMLLILILAAASGIIAVLAGFVLSAMIANPAQKTANLAKEIAAGNVDHEIDVKSEDEVGQLAAVISGEVREAFKNIQQAQVVSAKRREYQLQQVERVVVNLERLSVGTLDCDMVVDEPDEDTEDLFSIYNNISENLHKSVNTIKSYIDEISYTLGEMSQGNLTVGIDSEYQGDFTELKQSINMIIEAFNNILTDINTAAEQVASGTSQVSDGSQEISQGATEQASSIEELSASITEMAEQVKQSAENATTSQALASEAQETALEGNEKMKAMLDSMDEINESSASISKIISVIDDIAFQTNILALNAAVEAARAGAHGKGFAVVAEEVRNLAARSANAAKETTALIEGSIKKVEAGTDIANKTAESLVTIVDGSKESARLLDIIATASNEQATGIAQINRGIEQLSTVVQTNSATAQEGAAASEELSSQAALLKSMIAKFQLKDESSNAPIRQQPRREIRSENRGSGYSETVKPQIVLNDDEFGKY